MSAIKTQIKSIGCEIEGETGPKFSNLISAIEAKITFIIETVINTVHPTTKSSYGSDPENNALQTPKA